MWKANGPPWPNGLIKKRSQQEQLEKVCISQTSDANEFLPYFSLPLSFWPFELLLFVSRSECTANFLFFEIALCCLVFISSLACLLLTIHNRLVNSNVDKKPTARYEPRHCYVRQDPRLHIYTFIDVWISARGTWNKIGKLWAERRSIPKNKMKIKYLKEWKITKSI